MSKFDELNKELKSLGFKIEDDMYILDKVTYQTTIINGQPYKRPQHQMFKMEYIGEGCEIDDSESEIDDTIFYEFDIYDGDESVVTICVHDINELKEYINV